MKRKDNGPLENGHVLLAGLRGIGCARFSSPAELWLRMAEDERDCCIPITATITVKRGKVRVTKVELRELEL